MVMLTAVPRMRCGEKVAPRRRLRQIGHHTSGELPESLFGGKADSTFPDHALASVAREDEIVVFRMGLVAGEAGSVLGLVHGLAVDEPAKTPAAGGGVSGGVLDHDLD